MLDKIKRGLRKVKRKITNEPPKKAKKPAKVEKTKKPISPIKERRNKRVAQIVKKSGWTKEYTNERLEKAKKQSDISAREFLKYKLWEVSESEVEQSYRKQLKRECSIKNTLDEICEEAEWSEDQAKENTREIRKKYGISIWEYRKNELWKYEGEALDEKAKQIVEAKEIAKKEKVLEDIATDLRKQFILGDSVETEANGLVQPIKVACALLGLTLPEETDITKRPSDYVQFDGTLENLRNELTERILPDTEITSTEYRKFAKRFKNYGPVKFNMTDLGVFYTDWLFFAKDYGFNFSDYFEYKFFEKTIKERNTFLSQGYRGHVRDVCNTNIGLCKSKPRFNTFFAPYIKRDWLKVSDKNFAEFKEFVSKHDEFFSKPCKGGGGVGAGVLTTADKTVEELYAYCAEHECIVEELVKQHPSVGEFNPSTVNTIRLYTLIKSDGEVIVTGGAAKFGRPGTFADNLLQGGVGVEIDVTTGTISCDAVDVNCNPYTHHPDSNKQFVGFQYPDWDKLIAFIKEAALHAGKYNRHIGWDISIRDDDEIEIIEGNSWPDLSLLQVADCVGKKHFYKEYIDELEKRINMPGYPDIPECTISVNTVEQQQELKKNFQSLATNKRNFETIAKEDTNIKNAWLQEYEIKEPEYDYVKRDNVYLKDTKIAPKRYAKINDHCWESTTKKTNKARLMFTGDITCFEKQILEAEVNDTYDFDFEFDCVRDIFKQADLVVGNLETSIFPEAPYRTEKFVSEQNYYCNAPIEFLDGVRKAGFDVLTNANNHDLDTGAIGIGETIDYIENLGIIQTGTFKSNKKRYEIINVNGIKVAIVAFATDHNLKICNLTKDGIDFLLNNYSKESAEQYIKEAKEDGADIVFACIHWGKENKPEYRKEQHDMAVELAQAGYDIIVGSHPHVLQKFTHIKLKGGKKVPVFYSMGNFVSHCVRGATSRSIIAVFDLVKKEDGTVDYEISFVPIATTAKYGKKKFVVVPLKEDSSDKRNINRIKEMVDVLGDEISINKDISYDEYPEKKDVKGAVKKKIVNNNENPTFESYPAKFTYGDFTYLVYEDHMICTGLSFLNRKGSFQIPNRVGTIEITGAKEGAFAGEKTLRKINFRNNITTVPKRICKDCVNLEGFQITNKCEEIDDEAFMNCSYLNTAVFRYAMKRIGNRAFANCSNLRCVKIPNNVCDIADDAFDGCDRVIFYCEEGSYGYNWAKEHGFKVKHMDIYE